MAKIFLLIPLALSLNFGCGEPPRLPAKESTLSVSDSTLSISLPAEFEGLPIKDGGACGFDPTRIDGDKEFISGWAAISTRDGALAEAMLIGISANRSEKFAKVSRQKREDVATYFNNQALTDSGFSVGVSKADVPAGSRLTLYQAFQGSVYSCAMGGNPKK